MREFADVVAALDKIGDAIEQLFNQELGSLNAEQMYYVKMMRNHVTVYPDLIPYLREYLGVYRQPYDAVNLMSTEWRTPLMPLRDYSRFLVEGDVGTINDDQRATLLEIEALADEIWVWTYIGKKSTE